MGVSPGTWFAAPAKMSATVIICDHCQESLIGKAYRVISEDDGVTLLDMIVCHACYIEAQKLGLKTEELDSAIRYY